MGTDNAAAGVLAQNLCMLADLRDLFVPQRCIECGVAPSLWCDNCRRRLTPCVIQIGRGARLVAVSHANPAMMRAVSMWKDSGISQLSNILASEVAAQIQHHTSGGELDIVAIPSRRSSVRRRGGEPMLQLVRAVSRTQIGRAHV